MSVIVDGIVIDERLTQFSNAHCDMYLVSPPNVTFSRFMHPENIYVGMKFDL